jgi:hypothetical protein
MLSQGRQGGLNVMLVPGQTGFYLGEPSVSVPAEADGAAALTASRFGIRTWLEGDTAKVVVYAVVADPRDPARELETPIALHRLAVGERVRVTETERWGAVPVVLRLVQRVSRRRSRPARREIRLRRPEHPVPDEDDAEERPADRVHDR